jgi:6-hydroxy-3-succinoylpyridine 3-monooxygenase
MLRRHTNVISGLVIPTKPQGRILNTELVEQAHWVRGHITTAELSASQLPRVIPGKRPTIKPVSWYARPDLLNTVLERAVPVKGSMGKVFKWLEQANPHFGDKAPIDLIETDEGAAEVLNYMKNYIETHHRQA